jgi:hypothetical protein
MFARKLVASAAENQRETGAEIAPCRGVAAGCDLRYADVMDNTTRTLVRIDPAIAQVLKPLAVSNYQSLAGIVNRLLADRPEVRDRGSSGRWPIRQAKGRTNE